MIDLERCDLLLTISRHASLTSMIHIEVAVDEAMIKFTGRSTLKQFVPMKPVKRGIKVWALADSHNGYFHKFQVYAGKEGSGEKQLGQRVVKDLTQNLKGKITMSSTTTFSQARSCCVI